MMMIMTMMVTVDYMQVIQNNEMKTDPVIVAKEGVVWEREGCIKDPSGE